MLRAADQLIQQNRKRKPKDLVTDNAEGQLVAVLTFDASNDECDGIVSVEFKLR